MQTSFIAIYRVRLATYLIGSLLCCVPVQAQQGLALSGVGAINRSFGGVAVASPIDAAGAMHWNPATIGAFDRNEVFVGMEFLDVNEEVSSRIDSAGRSGSTNGDVNLSPIPNAAVIYHEPGSDLAYGFGLFGIAGFGVNYPSSATNPILAPPSAGGLGRVSGEAELLQLVPTIAYALSDRLFVGIAPTLTVARLDLDPIFVATPNADGTYPRGGNNKHYYGGGFQAGLFYKDPSGINLGASYKSPQWMEKFRFNAQDENGLPRAESFGLDYPYIVSAGIGYIGMQDWVYGLDLHYYGFGDANGFKESGFDSTGAVKGLSWNNIFSVATGVQYEPVENVALRIGYTFNENPIANSDSVFNIASPLIVQHLLGLGMSYDIAKNVSFSVAYLHGFKGVVEGPIKRPGIGDLPGTSVKNEVSADALAGGVTVSY